MRRVLQRVARSQPFEDAIGANEESSRCHPADVAEGVGFEPTEGCPSHAFQACRFGRSRTPPGVVWRCCGRHVIRPVAWAHAESEGTFPSGEVVTGPCATNAREPGQARNGAAFIGIARVPQIVWSPPQPTGADLPAAHGGLSPGDVTR